MRREEKVRGNGRASTRKKLNGGSEFHTSRGEAANPRPAQLLPQKPTCIFHVT
jgi:hypothetical protein